MNNRQRFGISFTTFVLCSVAGLLIIPQTSIPQPVQGSLAGGLSLVALLAAFAAWRTARWR